MSQKHIVEALPEGEPPTGPPSVDPENQSLPTLGDGGIPASTLDHYWLLFNDPGLSPLELTMGPSAVTHEAFLSLTKQVQAMVGMLQTLAPFIPQIVWLAAPPTDLTRQRPSG